MHKVLFILLMFLPVCATTGQAQSVTRQISSSFASPSLKYPLLKREIRSSIKTSSIRPSLTHQQSVMLSHCDPVDHLAFFCKLEVKTDRKANMPIRFRLGTVQYVDQLEGKYPGRHYLLDPLKR